MKIFRLPLTVFLLASAAFLAGCNYGDVRIDNLTSSTLSENPSNIYTLVARVSPNTAGVIPESIRPHIVIDGDTFPMKPSRLREDIYEFEFRLPADRIDAKYYFLVKYDIETRSGFVQQREAFSELYQFTLTNRYSYTLEVTRAPVGARVGVVGRGFKSGDSILVGGHPAATTFNSPNSLHFHVPPLEAGRSYPVVLLDGDAELPIGSLRVDAASVSVSPSSLSLRRGSRSMVVFSIQSPAPRGGLYIEVSTDIPNSVIMPEVWIDEGQRSVSIPVEGGDPGSGSLFIEMEGFESVSVPVRVR